MITNVRRYLKCIVLQILVGFVFSVQTLAIELDGSVTEHTLANGLRVLLLERHQAPTVSFVIRFKVGSVNEQAGMSGMAHLLEHMLFKGTKTLGTTDYAREQEIHEKIDGVIERLDAERLKGAQGDSSLTDRLETKLRELQQEQSQLTVKEEMSALYTRNGAVGLNASTGYDLTTYTVSLPANRQELWAAIEADRMLNPVFREVYLEREVVREDRRQRNESNPGGKLMEAFLTSAFQAHPYGRPIVGWDSDLQQLKRGSAVDFFRAYYAPNNTVITAVGDFEAKELLKLIETYFGTIASQEVDSRVITREPRQSGERRIQVTFDAKPTLIMGYHKPTLPSFEDYVFDVIEAILSRGRTSRLYRHLVEKKKIAVSASASNGFPGSLYGNLFTFFATPRYPHTSSEVEQAIREEVAQLTKEPVTQDELNKVKNQLEADFIRGLESSMGMARKLSYYEVVAGDWRYIEEHQKIIKKIKPADILTAARTYLTDENVTVAELVEAPKR